jgi:exopolysaccharide biosynthesis protein
MYATWPIWLLGIGGYLYCMSYPDGHMETHYMVIAPDGKVYRPYDKPRKFILKEGVSFNSGTVTIYGSVEIHKLDEWVK